MKLSIIIPVYNVEKYLPRCLDSVLYPNLSDYEIIIVNDGSSDSSPAIAARYAAEHPLLIRLISTENGGLGHARNTGLEYARGEYILFLDSDDRLSGSALPEIMDTLRGDFDICLFDYCSVNEADQVLKTVSCAERDGEFSLSQYPELLFQPPNACNKLWRRTLFGDDIRFPDRMWFEDLCTTPKLYLRAGKMLAVHKPWYEYLMRQGSITNSQSIGRNLDIITAVDGVIDYYKRMGCYERYKPQLEYMALYHELIASTTRVNLIDRESAVQDKLLEHFTEKFPNYGENPYTQAMGFKLKLLLFLIRRRRRLAINLIMRLNNLIKGK